MNLQIHILHSALTWNVQFILV